ncbi:serine hydrolase [Paenibacillus sp. GSMTC-2017]|nr:serine hydrolase [Paenibacillus sp. GSMTC-2017]
MADLSDVLKKEKIHSFLVNKDGERLFQYFKNNKLENKMNKINSVTKSITSSLIGIATNQGLIPDISTPIKEFFPSLRNDLDERKQLITIDHLLTMSAGFDWPEMTDWRGWPQMIHSGNWVKYCLDKPLLNSPGESMNYNSGCSHLLLAILQKATSKSAEQFANEHLFSHLTFNDYIWHSDPQGINIGGFGIHLTVHDMLKFGELYLRQGKKGKQQLISEEWIASTTVAKYMTYPHFGHYARHWWVHEDTTSDKFYFAMGMGGQYICVVPTRGIVIATTCDTHGRTLTPLRIVKSLLSQYEVS